MQFSFKGLVTSPAVAIALAVSLLTGAGVPLTAQAQSQPAASAASIATPLSSHYNVYVAGGQVRPAGPVSGDFTAAGGKITLDQPVGGDASLAAGSIDVRARVGDDLRAIGGDIRIDAPVGGELFASGGNIVLGRASAVGGGAKVYGGNVTLEGRVDGALDVRARKVTIDGEVRGDVKAAAEEIELGPLARISGRLSYASRNEPQMAQGASVAGPITRQDGNSAGLERPRADRRSQTGGGWEWGAWLSGAAFFYLTTLACTALLILIAPSFTAASADRIRSRPVLALAVGVASLFAVPLVAGLLFITLLGIPLGIVLLSLLPVLALMGFLVGAVFIARLIPGALGRPVPTRFAGNIGYVALAVLLLLVVSRVPFAGGLAVGLLSLAGLGAFLLQLRGARPGPSAEVPGGSKPVPGLPAGTAAENPARAS